MGVAPLGKEPLGAGPSGIEPCAGASDPSRALVEGGVGEPSGALEAPEAAGVGGAAAVAGAADAAAAITARPPAMPPAMELAGDGAAVDCATLRPAVGCSYAATDVPCACSGAEGAGSATRSASSSERRSLAGTNVTSIRSAVSASTRHWPSSSSPG